MQPTRRPSRRRHGRRGLVLGSVLVATAALGLTACGGSGGGAPVLTLYNAQHEQTTDALVAAFTKQTGIKVMVENNSEDTLTAQIVQEGSRSPADVFYSENSNWLEQLAAAGLLAKVDAPTLAAVPAQDSSTAGLWVGVSARISTMVYDTGKLAPSQVERVDREIAATDAEIDDLVYELYGITGEERSIVEGR